MMPPLATDWATISSLATAGGTLVLAPSRSTDPLQKIMFI